MFEITQEIQKQIRRVVIGKDEVVRKVLMAILSRGHVLLEDVPGVGKTTMALAFAKVLGLDTKRVQFTSDTLPSDIIGFSVYDRETASLQYKAGAVMTNLLLADEINRTSSKTQSALLEAMEERQVTVDGLTRPLPVPFIVLATQNPVGSAGTQSLPNSQLDRFLIRLHMGYPDLKSQIAIMQDRHHANPLDSVEPVTDIEKLKSLIQAAEQVHMADEVYAYTAELVEATRHQELVRLGVSPRGALAMCRAAKASAFLEGRDYVTPDDVAAVFPDVCAHRLMLDAKARLHEISAEQILGEILDQTARPDTPHFSAR